MLNKNFLSKIIVFVSISIASILTLLSITFAYPSFEFDSTSFPSGNINATFASSYGTQVSLYVNENFIGKKDITSPIHYIDIIDEITDIQIPVNSKLIFRNTNQAKTITITVPGYYTKSLSFGDQTPEIILNEITTLSYTNEDSGLKKDIITYTELGESYFSNIPQKYLKSGDNDFNFTIESLNSDFQKYTESYNIYYDKYPNTINLAKYKNITQENSIHLRGTVQDSQSPLYYVLNIETEIGNLGLLKPISLDGIKFNTTINGLSEGINLIRFLSTDFDNTNIFNGERRVYVEVDTIDPEIEVIGASFQSSVNNEKKVFKEGDNFLTNSNNLILNISTDASILNYTFNNKNFSEELQGQYNTLELNLEEGTNNLTLIAIDRAGNFVKLSKRIEFDSSKPDIEKDSLSPDNIFKKGTSHFSFEEISGKTTKPNVKMTIFTFPTGAKDSEGRTVSCEDYKPIFLTTSEDPVEVKVDISLLGLLNKKTETTSGSEGDFTSLIVLQESFDNINENTNSVNSVDSPNTLCMILEDKFGNSKTVTNRVKLDSGNTMWKLENIKTTPNNIYSGDIELTDSNSADTEFGIIATFKYEGPGEVDYLTNVHIQKDSSYEHSKYAQIKTDRVNYMLDKSSGEMIVYIPIGVKALGISPLEYPDQFEFGFGMRITYTAGENIPIDVTNPVYFKAVVNVENPLNSSKWLTPQTIESMQGFLNNTIKLTEKVNKGLEYATIGGVLYCKYAKLKYGFDVTQINVEYATRTTNEDKAKKEYALNTAKRKMFMACDRVAGLASPPKCEDGYKDEDYIGEDEYQHGIQFTSEDNVVGTFIPTVGGTCDPDGSSGPLTEANGTYVSGVGTINEERENNGAISYTQRTIPIEKQCILIKEEEGNKKINIGKFSSGLCFSPGPPKFDDTKCNFFGQHDDPKDDVENGWENSGLAGQDPSKNIIESITCGAITDTYKHTDKLLTKQQQIYSCLEEAKHGTIKGSYCERLMGQSVCDIATNIILPEVLQSGEKNGLNFGSNNSNLKGLLNSINSNQGEFNSRYGDTLVTEDIFQTDQIINKACLGAITGDWSVLTGSLNGDGGILGAIKDSDVEPSFGPPFAESRIQGYDPVSGELSLSYLFTYSALSGGQSIQTNVELLCDPNYDGGDYCPEDTIMVSSSNPYGTFKSKILSVRENQYKEESVRILESSAKIWYNKIRLTHNFKVKSESRTLTEEFPILHKEEKLPLECSWSAGIGVGNSGISCDGIFGDQAQIPTYNLIDSETKLLPTINNQDSPMPFYPGNSIYAQIMYSSINSQSNSYQTLDLKYIAICNEGASNQKILLARNGQEIGSIILNSQSSNVQSSKQIEKLYSSLPLLENQVVQTNNDANNNQNEGNPKQETITQNSYGTCNLYMRVLPSGYALNTENFKTYNPQSGSDAEGNIITKNNDFVNFITKQFTINAPTTNNQDYFNLVEPYNDQTICVGQNGILNLPINYIFQSSSQSSGESSYILNYKISSSSYVINDVNAKNSETLIYGKPSLPNKIAITLPDSLKNTLSSSSGSSLAGHISGVTPASQLIFSYNVKNGEENVVQDSFKFYLNSCDN